MNSKKYYISTGRSRLETVWRNREITWRQLTDKLRSSHTTAETVEAYAVMSKEQRGLIKDIGGFVGGVLGSKHGGKIIEGRRKAGTVICRSLVTLDIDYGHADTIGMVQDALAGCTWCIYSTHSHTPQSPRYRLIVPLDRQVTPDEYIPIARRIAADIGIDCFDDSTYEPSRLMYWPSTPRNGEYFYRESSGSELVADDVLDTYTDWRNVLEWPVSSRVQTALRPKGKKQEDPTSKPGVIGAFCRAYSISEAVESFLSDTYEQIAPNRYTYLRGSTAGGAVSYEDKWLYSHHGTDPCCEREVNAFDLVRIHRFGEMDADSAEATPVNKLPSFKAMSDFVMSDSKAAGQMAEDKMQEIAKDFGSLNLDTQDADGSWVRKLKTNKRKEILATPENLYTIFTCDPKLKGAIRHDAFRCRDQVMRNLPWRKITEGNEPYWNNSDDVNLLLYLSQYYMISGAKTAILDTWEATTSRLSFHPVRDYLNNLPKWDGIGRLETLLVDYLGAEDNELTRAMTRKHLTAAVARIMRPGIKYDYVLTLVGPEGIGKSTLIRQLGGEWFNDSFSTANIGDKEAMDQIRGQWLIEMGELKDYKRNTVEAFKAFISKQEDSYRPAYARKLETYRRQCVFFATTNERAFLKGDTGNRRFWVVDCGTDLPEKDVFSMSSETIGQIWAEALHLFRNGEKLYLDGILEEKSRNRQVSHNEITVDDRKGLIVEFIRKPLPATWWTLSKDERRDFFRGTDKIIEGESFRRQTICAMEIQVECFGEKYDKFASKDINQILADLGLEYLGPTKMAYTLNGCNRGDKVYGIQRRYLIPDKA